MCRIVRDRDEPLKQCDSASGLTEAFERRLRNVDLDEMPVEQMRAVMTVLRLELASMVAEKRKARIVWMSPWSGPMTDYDWIRQRLAKLQQILARRCR